MFAIEVEYLLGRAVASDPSQRDRAEWPPHPTRLFSALVDALADVSDAAERGRGEAALRWLERESPPEIAASVDDVSMRTVVKHFVPINDEPADPKNVRSAPLAEIRTRQERFFPASVPADPRVVFAWPESQPPADVAAGLSDLVRRVPYLGHSSSLVRIAVAQEAPTRNLGPALAGEFLLRVPGPGRLDRLNAVHELRKEDTYAQPPKGKEVPYARLENTAVAQGPHGAIRVVAFEGSRFGLHETAWVVSRFREALLSELPDGTQTPESLSGHGLDGRVAQRPHVAIAPLANVGGKHSDGALKGLAVLLPRDLSAEAMLLLDTALARIEHLVFGERGTVRVRVFGSLGRVGSSSGERSIRSLDGGRYSKSATEWASVTPVALGFHAKPRKGITEEEIVLRHVRQAGLPEPHSIDVQDVSAVRGSPPAFEFHRGKLRALAGRQLRHAIIRFARCIGGPLVIGAGAHVGFGLFLPTRDP